MSPRTRRSPARTGDAPWPVRRVESAGGVVVRDLVRPPEVALIRTRNLKGEEVWTLPKGTPEEGEDPEQTAIREVREETGLEVEVLDHLDDVTYWFSWAPDRVRYRKTVHLYLMRHIGGDPSRHDAEVDEVRFFPLPEARARASYASDRRVLDRLARLAESW